jgi:branched-chain amino acid transport system substrate-binding protein
MSKLGINNAVYCGISGIADEKFNELAGKSAEGTVIVKPGQSSNVERWADFEKAYEKQNYSEPMGAYGKYSYDAANIILAALKKVGPDKAKLVDAIRSISYRGLLGEYTFDSTGQTTLIDMSIMVSQDGKWIDWDQSEYAAGKRKLAGLK